MFIYVVSIPLFCISSLYIYPLFLHTTRYLFRKFSFSFSYVLLQETNASHRNTRETGTSSRLLQQVLVTSSRSTSRSSKTYNVSRSSLSLLLTSVLAILICAEELPKPEKSLTASSSFPYCLILQWECLFTSLKRENRTRIYSKLYKLFVEYVCISL